MRQPTRRSRVTVSVAPSFAAKWLLPRLERFTAARPDIDVWVSADMSPVDFGVTDVDIAIRYGPGRYEGLAAERLLEEAVLPVCSPGLMEAAPIRAPQDLAHHTLLHDSGPELDASCPDWSMWLKAHGVAGVDAVRGPRFNQSSLVIEAAVAGRGVALAKRAIAEADLAAGKLVAPFAGAGAPTAFRLSYRLAAHARVHARAADVHRLAAGGSADFRSPQRPTIQSMRRSSPRRASEPRSSHTAAAVNATIITTCAARIARIG